jgi:hypothetical protein
LEFVKQIQQFIFGIIWTEYGLDVSQGTLRGDE